LRFFFDMAVPVNLARGLAAFFPDDDIVHLLDAKQFGLRSDSTDVYIIETISQLAPRPVFITADRAMRTRGSPELLALRSSELTVVIFRKTFHELSFQVQAEKIVKAWPAIKEETLRCRTPTTFEVGPNGKVEDLGPTARLSNR